MCLCRKILQSIFQLASVLFVLYRKPSWSSGKKLTANAGGRRFESHRGQNLFFTFYSIKMECEELFCKTNEHLKLTIKIIVKLSILI